MPAKQDYITIAPVTPKGKWTICVRRIGSKDRFAPVAEARTQTAADGIVDALNLMQGEMQRIERPAQKLLEELRETLVKERAAADATRRDKRELENKVRSMETDMNIMRTQRDRAIADREIAQKAARENA